ncbi:dihydroorotate dehydrogenase [Sphaerochaeta pleomorpha str. Grapes]|uniref:dihydrouracil dehydrogenase (NAD(+)) n=1 Tax=Sphaerochaeta pleomorpha (strain ATCC BAA-1885 / DSM 22778 / Grapes) TaxID=158190 RepID=G8QXN1_SPHPG|nr:4Fe-4S binding protein [Sphaerochaeta pleomorpha]AEV29594.1 dihydroorotate dehydrogenase [Sphaerochaeta pleomorpha str. Grapes]
MADLYVEEFDMINPFVIASSPATQGARNLLKSAAARPGALVLRNFGHGSGGGSYVYPSAKAMFGGSAIHSHAVGTQIKDSISTLEQYCEEVRAIKRNLDKDIKLWVSVGHYSDIVKGGDWEKEWIRQAKELTLAGADAIELHFNTPGVAVAKDRTFQYYQLVAHCTQMIKAAVPSTPVMVKLALESCDVLTSMRYAKAAGATAVGPTARWKGFVFDLDWKTTQARPGSGYGGTQATPIVCYAIAEARTNGIDLPLFAGGGVFSHTQALQILMAGSNCVQIGALACSGGVSAVKNVIRQTEAWMDSNGYPDMKSLTGDALKLFSMDKEVSDYRTACLGNRYKQTQVDAEKCIGCGHCVDVCWQDSLVLEGKVAHKLDSCIGCGYCFQVCPVGALSVDAGKILKDAYEEKNR